MPALALPAAVGRVSDVEKDYTAHNDLADFFTDLLVFRSASS
jgi:hypothetical protein